MKFEALAATLVLTACSSVHQSPSENSRLVSLANDSRVELYTQAAQPMELQRLLDEDLQHDPGAVVYERLHAFVADHIKNKHAARALTIFRGADVETLFLFGDAKSYMNAAKELEKLLAKRAGGELDSAYNAARHGDHETLGALSSDPLGLLSPETIALDPTLRPHAALMQALATYSGIDEQSTEADVAHVLEQLRGARTGLQRSERPEGLFLADIATAQTLEQSGMNDEAAEVWLRVASSEYWPSAPSAMRNAVAARVDSYRQRLRDMLSAQLEEERLAEIRVLEASYSARVEELRAQVQEFDASARAGQLKNEVQLKELMQTQAVATEGMDDMRAFVGLAADVFTLASPVGRVLKLSGLSI